MHNLSAAGPGALRAPGEAQVCVFCHAPHSTQGMRPLWNRDTPTATYRIYESSTLDAQPRQPTGASKLCLSCHDGTIALGSVLSRGDRIRMNSGEFMPAGMANLGTDLSDDHPISFPYDPGLAVRDRQLAAPWELPPEVTLDGALELQCTTCHDAHNDVYGDFLVMEPRDGALCRACHRLGGWATSSHGLSRAPIGAVQTVEWEYPSMSENACAICHRAHTAGGHDRLLIFEKEEDNCLLCHGGGVGGANLRSELRKRSAHDPSRYQDLHDPLESGAGRAAHVECSDCHNPHAAEEPPPRGTGAFLPIGGTLRKVIGVNSVGAAVPEAMYEYEVCFRCHGDSPVQIRHRPQRQCDTDNIRLKFSPTNPSFHPVVTSSPSTTTVSLVPGLSPGTMVRCSDCHNNDEGPGAGGAGPDGPHGSIHAFLLERNYTTDDNVPESPFEYALCYKCHRRSSIANDESFPLHKLHVMDARAPCAACHDAHGVSPTAASGSDHTHLINFDTVIVQPESSTGAMEFRDRGRLAGSCTLVCHGVTHLEAEYD
ncbi:MAG: cytochrome c3 family protein [Planctomycetota bacterium]